MADLFLAYDTETTGLPLWKEPSEDPRQPHIVQLTAELRDLATGEVVSQMDRIIKPDGWEIPVETSDIHGITTEIAIKNGIPENEAIAEFMRLWGKAQFRVAHNESFDARILRIGLKRFFGEDLGETWSEGPARCTARLSTSILKLPPTAKQARAFGPNSNKTPTLTEAYEGLLNKPFIGAHNAFADTTGCAEVFLWLHKNGHVPSEFAAKGGASPKRVPAKDRVSSPPPSVADDIIDSL